MPEQGKALEGIFLQPTQEEAAEIWAAVADEGLPQTPAGVLELFMIMLREEEPEETPIMEYLKKNPEILQSGQAIFKAGLSKLAQKFKK